MSEHAHIDLGDVEELTGILARMSDSFRYSHSDAAIEQEFRDLRDIFEQLQRHIREIKEKYGNLPSACETIEVTTSFMNEMAAAFRGRSRVTGIESTPVDKIQNEEDIKGFGEF